MRRCPGRRSDRPPNFGPIYGGQKQSPPCAPRKWGCGGGLLNSYIKCIYTNQRYDPESKLTILDLKLETNTGKLINVEMQLLLLKSLIQRILFYLSQMLVGQLEPNQKYKNLKRVISVLIINEEMFPEDELLHHCFRFADKHAKIELTDLMEVNILELSKAREKKNIETPLDVWRKFLAADKKEEFMQLAE